MFNQHKNYKKAGLGALALFLTTGLLTLTFAFTNTKSEEQKLTVYYWYHVNDSGEIEAGSEAFDGLQKDRIDAENEMDCPTGVDADCIRGFSSPIPSFPTEALGDTPAFKKAL